MSESAFDLAVFLLSFRRFVVIEGPDGVGKTTLIKSLVEHQAREGTEIVVARCPDNVNDARIRDTIMSKEAAAHPGALPFLFMAGFVQSWESIIVPAMNNPDTKFILDRFVPSTAVYQNQTLDFLNLALRTVSPIMARAMSTAGYLYMFPGDMTSHLERLKKKQGDELNHLDPSTQSQIVEQIRKYRAFVEEHKDKSILGSHFVYTVDV